MSNNQGDMFGFDNDDLELEKDLRGPSKFDASSIPDDHPYLPQNQNKAPKVFASSSRFRKGAPRPTCPKTPRGNRFGRRPPFWGSRPDPEGPGL